MSLIEIALVVVVLVASIYGLMTKDWRASFVGLGCSIAWILVRILSRM